MKDKKFMFKFIALQLLIICLLCLNNTGIIMAKFGKVGLVVFYIVTCSLIMCCIWLITTRLTSNKKIVYLFNVTFVCLCLFGLFIIVSVLSRY